LPRVVSATPTSLVVFGGTTKSDPARRPPNPPIVRPLEQTSTGRQMRSAPWHAVDRLQLNFTVVTPWVAVASRLARETQCRGGHRRHPGFLAGGGDAQSGGAVRVSRRRPTEMGNSLGPSGRQGRSVQKRRRRDGSIWALVRGRTELAPSFALRRSRYGTSHESVPDFVPSTVENSRK
jgi:hypothetical protein